MEQLIIISAFDNTGKMVEPWAEAGYLCYCIDIQHPAGETRVGNIIFVGCSVYDWQGPSLPGRVAAFFAFPPCTHLAVSGARWFAEKERLTPGTRFEAMRLVYWGRDYAKMLGVPFFLENPVSVISSEWRKPDYSFNPCEYGGYLEDYSEDAYTKRTCLWTGGGFIMPCKKPVEAVLGSKMHLLPPSEERANLRSATPAGFARAVFEANHKPRRFIKQLELFDEPVVPRNILRQVA